MNSHSHAPQRAFTLIELLIVVAIIAILAAIAVPNLLEAQTRGKVSRAKADMRSLATAIEAYAVDANNYPWPDDEFGRPIIPGITNPLPEGFETRIPIRLTTPISYVTSLFSEPFPAQVGTRENRLFHYSLGEYFNTEGAGETEFNAYTSYLLGGGNRSVLKYLILSHGPDQDHDDPDDGAPALYDPTNGTTSNGDIIYFGPGTGFQR